MFSELPLGTDQNHSKESLESLKNNFLLNNQFIFSFKDDNEQLIALSGNWWLFSFALGTSLNINNRRVVNVSEEIFKDILYYGEHGTSQELAECLRRYLDTQNNPDTEVNLLEI